MSIKQKLSLFIVLIVAITLTANISISYYTSKDVLHCDLRKQMKIVANEIGIAIAQSEYSSEYIDGLIGNKLHTAAIAAEHMLDPDIEKVTNEQLIQLSRNLGVTHISLFGKKANDIIVLKSSDPRELQNVSDNWSFGYKAMQQLFSGWRESTEGKLTNFISSPFQTSTSDSTYIEKQGYYFDGTTNYIIQTYVIDSEMKTFEKIAGTQAVLDKTMKENQELLEITGFNPHALPIIFGQYTFIDDKNDEKNVREANQTNSTITREVMINGVHVIKSFIPVQAQRPYVIGLVTDYNVIQQVLDKQLKRQVMIALVILAVVFVSSYYLAAFSLRSLDRILQRVHEISESHFDSSDLFKPRKDEWGLLAAGIQSMSRNLEANTTQLQRAVEELGNTKQFLESIFNYTSDAIHVIDLKWNVLKANKAFEMIYGWSEAETVGYPLRIIPEHYQDEADRMKQRVFNGSQVSGFETVRQMKDGRFIDVSLTVSPIRNETGKIIALATISRDITARKHTEELLRRSEKLSIVGQLAAGVAHEIRNPLTTLRGFVQLYFSKRHGNEQHLRIMLSELDRINFIVSEFLILAKPQVSHFQYRDLQQILQDIILLLDTQANMNNVQVYTEFLPELPLINCEENQLKQVFINVLKNGMEAMPNGGEIRIQVLNIGSGRVMVRIADQGVGIPEDQIEHVGEPFFTNKETGNGLGLMVSHQIIANHKGNLFIRSELGIGTTVDIILPIGESMATA